VKVGYVLTVLFVTKSVNAENETPLLAISGNLFSTFGISDTVFLVLKLPEVNLEYCRYEKEDEFLAV